jgi:pimeloyl-ACP methyl ester carboxylesterase
MSSLHSRSLLAALVVLVPLAPVDAQQTQATDPGVTYTVFLRQRPVGEETLQSIVSNDTGIVIRGSNRLGPPLDVVTRVAEVHYTSDWRPTRLTLEGTTRGQEISIKTTFAGGQATSEITVAGKTDSKVDAVAPDTLVLPNAFLGSYAAMTRRLTLTRAQPGTEFRGYIAPQGEVPMRLDGVFQEQIQTPRETIAATRYAMLVSNPAPAGEMQISVWADASGNLLRMSVPAQMLEVAREDIASAAARTTSFSIPGDETVNIPASGFNLAASIAKPANATGPLPAIVIVGGITVPDRDGVVNGIPVLGQLAATLVDAGFVVVRYDRRGVGQSGGRAETATIADYAEDVRAVVRWLQRERQDVDDDRIAVVGHNEGAWVALRAAEREDRIRAIALIEAGSSPGHELILEQQRTALERAKTPADAQKEKIELQERINAAVLKGQGWEGVPDTLRNLAETPWFQSYLAFEPLRVLRDTRQPILIVRGSEAGPVPPQHADRLLEAARARKRPAEIVGDVGRIGAWIAANLK